MYAATEQRIVDRLRAKLGTTPAHVLAELERVPELRQKAPAVFVIYDGYTVGDRVEPGHVQSITQDWYVVCATKSAKGAGDTSAARDAASDLCSQVLAALLGYPLGGGAYMKLADAPGPEYDGGFCYVPLAFTTRATFKGDPT